MIFWEGDSSDPTRKPPEMYTLIENFCLGLRRLEIFGRPSSLRRGWVTVMGQDQDEHLPTAGDTFGSIYVEGEDGGQATRWDRETWEEGVRERANGGKAVVPMTPEIDALRPKSPYRPNQTNSNPQGNNNPRFGTGMRGGFMNGGQPGQGQVMGQNQMLMQPMMGMGMNHLGMGMGNNVGVGVDEMMGVWNPMMGGMGNMNVAGMGNMNVANMGRMNAAAMRQMGMPMIGHMGMAPGFGTGGPVFNGAMNSSGMGWGDQSQFGVEGGWEGDGMMNVGVNGMGNGMNMNMNMGGGGMGMGQWGASSGTF